MKIGKWKRSKYDKNWWYIPNKGWDRYSNPTIKTLNIVKWKNKEYRIYLSERTKIPILLKKTKDLESARKFAINWMKTHPRG
ncbi:MAG: hypothetical protein ACTSQG_10620 [Promethearchaeota archaeon]